MKSIRIICAVVTLLITLSWAYRKSPRQELPSEVKATSQLPVEARTNQDVGPKSDSLVAPVVTNTTPDARQGVPAVSTVHSFKSEYQSWTDASLKERIQAINDELADRGWIELANSGQLSQDGMEHLGQLLDQESAAKLILLEREINRVERTL